MLLTVKVIHRVGAAGPILGDAVKRISSALDKDGLASMDKHEATIRRSFVLSSDQAHALVSVLVLESLL